MTDWDGRLMAEVNDDIDDKEKVKNDKKKNKKPKQEEEKDEEEFQWWGS